MRLPTVHLCIVQPLGYVHSLGFLDQARFFRHQFRRMGAEVSLAKNRLRHDAVNFIFGAHLGFDEELRSRYTCVFVNLEQLGRGGAAVSPAYLKLLGNAAVVDYDAGQRRACTPHTSTTCRWSPSRTLPTLRAMRLPSSDRPIDILFFGSLNPRREQLIQQVESSGRTVTLLSGPVYGPERDELIKQAKVVLNCHFYDSARFEQARAFQCMSLGTPVVSECDSRARRRRPSSKTRSSGSRPAISRSFFAEKLRHGGVRRTRRAASWRPSGSHDVIEQYADALAFGCGYRKVQAQRMHPGAVAAHAVAHRFGQGLQARLVQRRRARDLRSPTRCSTWPSRRSGRRRRQRFARPGRVAARASLSTIYANNVLEHVADLTQLMTNCLRCCARAARC